MTHLQVKKLAIAALLVAVGVACSPVSFPVGASRCFPVQHMVNILAAVFLGPWYGFGMAFCTSLLRNLIGTGTLLAFPGSMCGALLCGLTFRYSRSFPLTYIAEVFGTAVVGGLAAWPIAVFLLGKEAALLAYVLPFLVSTAGGTVIAALLLLALKRSGAYDVLERSVRS